MSEYALTLLDTVFYQHQTSDSPFARNSAFKHVDSMRSPWNHIKKKKYLRKNFFVQQVYSLSKEGLQKRLIDLS